MAVLGLLGDACLPRSERVFNVLLGLSVLSWAVLGMVYSAPPSRYSLSRLVITVLHVAVGSLLILRAPMVHQASTRDVAASLPALVLGGCALWAAPQGDAWPRYSEGLFAAGGLLTFTVLVWLGRNFAILPAVREIVVSGPFRWVRHPMFVGELLMILACCLARPSGFTALLMVLSLPLITLRIAAEERILIQCDTYARYVHAVRWRLLPGIW